jgi:hypothetical protein
LNSLLFALLTLKPNAFNAGHFLAIAYSANYFVNPLFEHRDVAKRGWVNHRNGSPGVGDAGFVKIEINHLSTHRSAIERTRLKPKN